MKKFKSFLFVFLLMLIVLPGKVFAEDKIVQKVDGASVKVGQEFTVNVTISNASYQKTLHGYNIVIKYDGGVLEYK